MFSDQDLLKKLFVAGAIKGDLKLRLIETVGLELCGSGGFCDKTRDFDGKDIVEKCGGFLFVGILGAGVEDAPLVFFAFDAEEAKGLVGLLEGDLFDAAVGGEQSAFFAEVEDLLCEIFEGIAVDFGDGSFVGASDIGFLGRFGGVGDVKDEGAVLAFAVFEGEFDGDVGLIEAKGFAIFLDVFADKLFGFEIAQAVEHQIDGLFVGDGLDGLEDLPAREGLFRGAVAMPVVMAVIVVFGSGGDHGVAFVDAFEDELILCAGEADLLDIRGTVGKDFFAAQVEEFFVCAVEEGAFHEDDFFAVFDACKVLSREAVFFTDLDAEIFSGMDKSYRELGFVESVFLEGLVGFFGVFGERGGDFDALGLEDISEQAFGFFAVSGGLNGGLDIPIAVIAVFGLFEADLLLGFVGFGVQDVKL